MVAVLEDCRARRAALQCGGTAATLDVDQSERSFPAAADAPSSPPESSLAPAAAETSQAPPGPEVPEAKTTVGIRSGCRNGTRVHAAPASADVAVSASLRMRGWEAEQETDSDDEGLGSSDGSASVQEQPGDEDSVAA